MKVRADAGKPAVDNAAKALFNPANADASVRNTTTFVSAQPSLSEAEAKRERLLQELAADDYSDAPEGMDAASRSC
eukprot:5164359-Pleurochrysis_carterae.AAC.1